MGEKIAMSFMLLGDSLSSGMTFSFNGTWFDFDRHKGSEQVGLAHIFSKQCQKFVTDFNNQLAQTIYLKKYISEIYVTPNSFTRANLSIAHYNPAVSPTFVAHEMYAPNEMKGLSDPLYDTLLIALGTNDTQDFNTLALECLFKLLDDSELQVFLDTLNSGKNNDDLTKRLREGYTHLKNPNVPFASLMPKFYINKEANTACLKAAKSCNFKRDGLLTYIKNWEEKQYWSKTTEEITETLNRMISKFIESQCIDQRGYGNNIAIILPPALPRDCIFPTYHQTYLRITSIREALAVYANSKNYQIIDLDLSCRELDKDKPSHGDDNLHLTSYAYNKIEENAIFNDLFLSSFKNRVISFLKKSDQATENYKQALNELDNLILKLNTQKQKNNQKIETANLSHSQDNNNSPYPYSSPASSGLFKVQPSTPENEKEITSASINSNKK